MRDRGEDGFRYKDPAQTARVIVCYDGEDTHIRGKAIGLAARLALPFRESLLVAEPEAEFVLVRTDRRLELRETSDRRARPIHVDFLSGATGFRRQSAASRRQPIAKAIGMSTGVASVLDATAGLARDTFLLACLGLRVIAVERCPFLAALIEDGLSRAKRDGPAELLRIVERIAAVNADARDVLRSATSEPPDAVYVDPMYPGRTKAALAKKEMRICRRLVGDDEDAAELLTVARSVAKRRVVVKRPRLAPPLGPEPDLRFGGKQVRYDVYLTALGKSG